MITGTAEDALDTACAFYLADPRRGSEVPTNSRRCPLIEEGRSFDGSIGMPKPGSSDGCRRTALRYWSAVEVYAGAEWHTGSSADEVLSPGDPGQSLGGVLAVDRVPGGMGHYFDPCCLSDRSDPFQCGQSADPVDVGL